MTYNVFGGTLSLTQSINQSVRLLHSARLVLEHSFLICRFVLGIFRSLSCIRVVGSRCRSQEQKKHVCVSRTWVVWLLLKGESCHVECQVKVGITVGRSHKSRWFYNTAASVVLTGCCSAVDGPREACKNSLVSICWKLFCGLSQLWLAYCEVACFWFSSQQFFVTI